MGWRRPPDGPQLHEMNLIRGRLCVRCAKRYLRIWHDRLPDDTGAPPRAGCVLIVTNDGRFLWKGTGLAGVPPKENDPQ